MTIQRNCNCDNELFQNFKNSFVSLPSSTGSEQAFDKLKLTIRLKFFVTLSLSKCDFKLFQNFKNSFVSLPSSTGSEQAFDKLRASWLSLTLDFKPYVTLSLSKCDFKLFQNFKNSFVRLRLALSLTLGLKSVVTLSKFILSLRRELSQTLVEGSKCDLNISKFLVNFSSDFD